METMHVCTQKRTYEPAKRKTETKAERPSHTSKADLIRLIIPLKPFYPIVSRRLLYLISPLNRKDKPK